MSRPPRFGAESRIVNLRLPRTTVDRLDAAAATLGHSRSRFLRAAIHAAIARVEADANSAPAQRCPICIQPMQPWAGQTVIRDGVLGPPKTWRCEGCRITYDAVRDKVVREAAAN